MNDGPILERRYWNLQPSYDLTENFPYSSRPSSSSAIKSEDEDEDVKWRIEYNRAVKKHRTDHPEFDHGYYIDTHNIIHPTGWIPTNFLPSSRGLHTYDCRCHTCYDWTKDPSICSNTGSSDRSTASHK